MPKLPNEDGFKVEIRRKLSKHFVLARRLLKFATHVFSGKREPTLSGGIDERVAVVSFGLFAKMCKQYRGILALSELGLSNDALGLARMLFESMLALQFILRRKVNLKVAGVAVPGMSSRFRTDLYLANHFFQRLKQLRCTMQMPGFKRMFTKKEMLDAQREEADWQVRIGPVWTQRLKKGFSGLTVEELATRLHFRVFYNCLYREASISVHAADGFSFVKLEDLGNGSSRADFDYTPSDRDSAVTIGYSHLMLAHCIDAINKRMSFGIERMVARFVDEIIELNEVS